MHVLQFVTDNRNLNFTFDAVVHPIGFGVNDSELPPPLPRCTPSNFGEVSTSSYISWNLPIQRSTVSH